MVRRNIDIKTQHPIDIKAQLSAWMPPAIDTRGLSKAA
jgi:hypothetical protein